MLWRRARAGHVRKQQIVHFGRREIAAEDIVAGVHEQEDDAVAVRAGNAEKVDHA